jgi:hypothetical protein
LQCQKLLTKIGSMPNIRTNSIYIGIPLLARDDREFGYTRR